MNDTVNKKKSKKSSSGNLKFLLSYTKKYRTTYILLLILLLLLTSITIYLPYNLGKLVDELAYIDPETSSSDFINPFTIMAITYIGLRLIHRVFYHIFKVTTVKTGNRVVKDIRNDVFNHIEDLSIEYFNQNPVGSLVSRIVNDTQKLIELYTGVLLNLLNNIVLVLTLSVVMFVLDYRLSIVTITIIPIVIVASIIFRRLTSRGFVAERKEMSILNAALSENISGMKIIQGFNQEERIFDKFDKQNKKHMKEYLGVLKTFSAFKPSLYLLRMISTVAILLLGSYLVLEGEITIGLVLTFMTFSDLFFEPINQIADQLNVVQQALAATENLNHIIHSNDRIFVKEDSVQLKDSKGKIEFKDVSFGYVEDELVLKNISFTINAGETIAFVGPTGGGKTTILKLIARYYDVTSGEILIDGINVKDYDLKSLRSTIGQMLQDVKMFTGDLKDNITLFDDSYTEEEIHDALKFVNAEPVVNKLDNGLSTEVRENGNNFSSGERQLFSFARTVIKKPSILILDEATSNIDSETEVVIQDTLVKMMNIGTMLIVAHRLSTIQHSDKIFVIGEGKILEQGNHQELLAKKGKYHELYTIQYLNSKSN